MSAPEIQSLAFRGEKGVKRGDEAWMRLAVAQHGLKNASAAIASLQKAITFDDTRKQASEWLRHLSGQVVAEQKDPSAESAG